MIATPIGETTMEDLFRGYWWLLFPLAWFVCSGWSSFLNYRRQRQTLDVIKNYAAAGREPPPEVLKVLERPIDAETEFWNSGSTGGGSSSTDGHIYTLVLFAALAAGFGYATWADVFGAGEAFLIVAIVMGALALASLVSVVFRRRPKG